MKTRQNARTSNRVKSPKTIGRSLARALDFEFGKAGTVAYGQVVRNLRKLESSYLKQLVGNPTFILEVRRRISEHLLELAILRGCAQQTCRTRLNEAIRLGFTDIEQEAHYRLLYAKGALARGHRRTAKNTASEMVHKLKRSLKRRKSLLGQQCLLRTEEFLAYVASAGARS